MFRIFFDVVVRRNTQASRRSDGSFPACPFSIMVRVLSRCRDRGTTGQTGQEPLIGPGLDNMMKLGWTRAAVVLAGVIGTAGAAQADRIKNPTAVFSGLDKI